MSHSSQRSNWSALRRSRLAAFQVIIEARPGVGYVKDPYSDEEGLSYFTWRDVGANNGQATSTMGPVDLLQLARGVIGLGRLAFGLGSAVLARSAAYEAMDMGRVIEAEILAARSALKETAVWRPSVEQANSAAFRVIVGEARYTIGGRLRGTIVDAVTETGLLEIKSGTSLLTSSYQLRLQVYRSLVENTPLTIQTSRPLDPIFRTWLHNWGANAVPLP